MNKANEFYVLSLESLMISRFHKQVNELLNSYNGKPITNAIYKKHRKSRTGELTLFFIYNVFDRKTKTDNVIGICRINPLYPGTDMHKHLYLRCRSAFVGCTGDKKTPLYLSTFVIRPTHRGEGHGKKLMSFIMWYTQNNNVIAPKQSLILLVGKKNEAAVHIYKKAGFGIVGGYDTKDSYGPEHLMAYKAP